MASRSTHTWPQWCAAVDEEATRRGVSIEKKDYLCFAYDDYETAAMVVDNWIHCEKAQADFERSLKTKPQYVIGVPYEIKEIIDAEKAQGGNTHLT